MIAADPDGDDCGGTVTEDDLFLVLSSSVFQRYKRFAALRDNGLLAPAAGGNTIRFLPPLITTMDQLERATAILRLVLASKG